MHVVISDFTPYDDTELNIPYQYCIEEYLRFDITITGVDVKRQGINFYDFADLCCEEHKPIHYPIDQIVCLNPEVQYGKIKGWRSGFVLTPPNFIISDENDCEDFYAFDPLNHDDWDMIENFDYTNIEDQYSSDEGELRNVPNSFTIFKI